MSRRLFRKLFSEFSFGMLFLEFISIILAIFLGYLATNWNENRIEKKEAREALALMCDELTQNYNNLQYYQSYYHRMLFLVDSLDAIGQFDTLFEMEEYHSINPPIVYTFAYEMAKTSSKLANINHEKAITIFMNYESLMGLQRSIEQAQSRILANQLEDVRDWKLVLNFLREPIDLFFRDYPLLHEKEVCPLTD